MNRKIEYRDLLKEVQGLLPMPGVMARVSRALREDGVDLDGIAELVKADATLVGQIVRLSNSSYFGFAEASESLEEALQRLGLRELYVMVGACAADQAYESELLHYRIPSEVFWESSIGAGLLMQRLAAAIGLDEEAAYLIGLFREVGMLVVERALQREGLDDTWDCELPLHLWERSVTGFDHMEAGAELLERWGFGLEVFGAVRLQWRDEAEGSGLAGLLELANRILARTGCVFAVPLRDLEGLEELLRLLGLDGEEVLAAVEEASSTAERLRRGVLEGKG